MKKFILLIIAVIQISLIFSVTNYKDYIDNEIGIEEYPNASAVNIITEINLSINEDYSYEYNVFYVKKILTYKGKKRYSDVKFEYNSGFESIEFGDCFTVNSKGEKVEIPEEAFHNSEHYFTMFSPEYINKWEKIINFPEIEPGNYIVVNYTRINNRKEFVSGIEHLMEENPYLEKRFIVTYPENLEFYVNPIRKLENLEIKHSKENGIIKEEFIIRNAELVLSEENSPSYVYTGCPIFYSNEKNWTELGNKIFERFNSGIEITDLISEKAKEITSNCSTEREKIFAIYDYLARNFIIKFSELQNLNFKPDPLEEVFEKKYGCKRDIVALFLGLVKAAGIKKCYPVLQLDASHRFENIQKKNSIIDFINNINVFWNNILISPGNDSYPFGYAGVNNCNIIIGEKKPVFKKYSFESSRIISKKAICRTISDDEYIIDYTSIFSGSQDSKYRSQFRNESVEKTKIWFSNQQKDKSSILTNDPEFLNLEDLDKNVELKYSSKVKGFLTKQDNYLYFSLPLEKIPLNVGAKNRVLPYQIYSVFSVEEEFIIEDVPENMSVIKPKGGVQESFKFGKQEIEYKIEIEHFDNNLVFKRTVNISEGLIPVEQYKELRNFINNLNNPTNNVIFLKNQ